MIYRAGGQAVVRNRPEGILGDVKEKGGENDEEGGCDDAVNGRRETRESPHAALTLSLIRREA